MRPVGNREPLTGLSVLADGGLSPLGWRQASRVEQCLPQQVFDLAIEAPQIVLRPPLQRAVDQGVQAQEKRFAF